MSAAPTTARTSRARLGRLAALLHSWPIIVIMLVGAVIRIDHVKQPFIDFISWRQSSVAMIAENYYRVNPNIFYPQVSWDGPGPSYQGREFQTVSYLASLLYRVFGQEDWIGRSIAIGFGLLGIFALYQLVRRLWGEEHALAAAALLAIMPGAAFFARSFIPDPAMVALVVTSCWMLVSYLQTGRDRFLVLAAVTGCLGFLTKAPGLLVCIPMAYAIVSILGRQGLSDRRRLVKLGVAAFAAITPVIAYYAWAKHLADTYPPYHFAGAANWVWVEGFGEWVDQDYFVPRAVSDGVGYLWTAPVMALAVLGLLVRPPGARRGVAASTGPGRAPWFFHAWLLGCLLFYVIGARELVDNPWNFHIFDPAVAAFAGRGVILVGTLGGASIRSRVAVGRIAIVLLVVWVVGQHGAETLYRGYSRETYAMGLALREISRPGDLVVTLGNDIGEPTGIYYSRRKGWTFPPADPTINWGELPADDGAAIAMFDGLRERGANWFAVADERKADFWSDHPALVDHVNRTCEYAVKTDQYYICRILPPGQEVPA